MNISPIYDQRYSGEYREKLSGIEIARWKAIKHFISKVIRLKDAQKVLDYGAGVGLYVSLWNKSFPRANLSFCDISPIAMEKFRLKYPDYVEDYLLIQKNRANFPDNTFDVIVSIEVMEHVENLYLYLEDIHRLLIPGGFFVWTTPCANHFSIEHIYAVLTNSIEQSSSGSRRWTWEDATHIRRLKSREIAELLRQNRFERISFRFRAHLFSFMCENSPIKSHKKMRDFFLALDYSIFRRMPNGASMIGAAQKKLQD